MILSRIIEHVKAQNWTAIAIDFVIVVMGVFVGLQVNNWNAARAEAAQEREFLAAIADDLRAERTELQQGARNLLASIGAADYALVAIGEAGGEAFAEQRAAAGGAATVPDVIAPDAMQKSWLWRLSVGSFYPTASIAAFDALTNTGKLSIIKDTDLIRALQNYRQRWRGLEETQAGTMRPLRNEALKIGGRYGLSLVSAVPEQDMLQKLKESEELRALLQNQIVFKTLHYELVVGIDREAEALLATIEAKDAQQ